MDPAHDAALTERAMRTWQNAYRGGGGQQRYRQLLDRAKPTAARDVAAWALNAFCHATGEVWDTKGDSSSRSGWAASAVHEVVAPARVPEVKADGRISRILSQTGCCGWRLMFAPLEDVVLAADERELDDSMSIGGFANTVTLNEVRLAHLLNVCARLALDRGGCPS